MTTWDCIVIGGGLAGISAAVRLADAGMATLLLDNRPFLGGRASSFREPVVGELVDACQHVTLGCCTALDALLRQLGVQDRVHYLSRVEFSLPDGSRASLAGSLLPAPYHLLPSFLGMRGLSLRDKIATARLLRAAMDWGTQRQPDEPEKIPAEVFSDVCRAVGLTEAARQRLIEPIILSACNARLNDVAAQYGLMVLYEALCAGRMGYRLGAPAVPLAELYTEPTRRYLEERHSRVMLRTTVVGVSAREGDSLEVGTLGGERFTCRRCVVAVPWFSVGRILPASLMTTHQRNSLAALEPSPIVGTHLWLDRKIEAPEALCLVGARTHWVFHRPRADSRSGNEGSYLATVTSADPELAHLDSAEIATQAFEDIRERIPPAAQAKLVHWRCVCERRATFLPCPGVDALRPLHRTRDPRIVIAGDWTATGWPATMEGAVRSGSLAAEALLTDTA